MRGQLLLTDWPDLHLSLFLLVHCDLRRGRLLHPSWKRPAMRHGLRCSKLLRGRRHLRRGLPKMRRELRLDYWRALLKRLLLQRLLSHGNRLL